MTRRSRLDLELVRRGLASSRTEAKRVIESGEVRVNGLPASGAATLVSTETPIAIAPEAARFVSRGGDKLDHALARLTVQVGGKRWLDAGASTGGFTDRLLQGGAHTVAAVDVGYGQLHWKIREDPRVVVIERKNVRELASGDLPWPPDGVVADLSFISLALVLPAVAGVAATEADFVLLVKPQFEAGREAVNDGVVRDPDVWRACVERVASVGRDLGLGMAGVCVAEPPGPAGNREFFLHLRRGADMDRSVIDAAIEEARP